MLRVIIKREYKDPLHGYVHGSLETLDIDCPELESVLTGGGVSEDGYDLTSVAGIEVLPSSETA